MMLKVQKLRNENTVQEVLHLSLKQTRCVKGRTSLITIVDMI